jgi:hypothetical protein
MQKFDHEAQTDRLELFDLPPENWLIVLFADARANPGLRAPIARETRIESTECRAGTSVDDRQIIEGAEEPKDGAGHAVALGSAPDLYAADAPATITDRSRAARSTGRKAAPTDASRPSAAPRRRATRSGCPRAAASPRDRLSQPR